MRWNDGTETASGLTGQPRTAGGGERPQGPSERTLGGLEKTAGATRRGWLDGTGAAQTIAWITTGAAAGDTAASSLAGAISQHGSRPAGHDLPQQSLVREAVTAPTLAAAKAAANAPAAKRLNVLFITSIMERIAD